MTKTRNRSGLPVELVDTFWNDVERVLRNEHSLTNEQALRAILRFRNEIDADEVGDILYHQSASDVANGIMTGGCAA